jgi:hypothetical protein
MGSKALQQILGYDFLSGAYDKIKTGVPMPLPAQFYAVTKQEQDNQARYVERTGTRQVSQSTRYGAKSKNITHTGLGEKTLTMIHSLESWDIDPRVLLRIMDENGTNQRLGESEIMRLLQEDKVRADNLRATAVHLALLQGVINLDYNTLLPDDTGQVVQIDYGVNATTNKGACKDILDADIFSGAWATSTTNIQGELDTVKRTAIQRTGYPLRYAFYGKNVKGYLNNNDTLGNLMNGNSVDANTALRGMVPEIENLLWVDASTAFWETADVDGNLTLNNIVPADTVVFTPDPAMPSWWEMTEGSAIVPTTNDVFGNPMDVLASMDRAYGQFAYGVGKTNPVTGEVFHGDTFLPMLLSPDAIYIATVESA